MTGCDTITLKRFKIPFGAVEMTQKLKAHTVLPEVLVFGFAHPHEAAHIICKSRESASLFQPSRHYLQCCAYVCSHTDTKHKDISFLPLLPPSLPSSTSFFSLSLPISLSLWKVGLLLCLFKHGQQSFYESSGDPSRGSGNPWINSGQKGRDNGTRTKSSDPSTDVSLWKSQTDNIFSQRTTSFEKQTYGKKHKRTGCAKN